MPSGGPVIHVVGARPNFMKLAPVYFALSGMLEQSIVHTGQHYDERMSGSFFQVLGLPEPDINLGVGPGSHAEQTARVMLGLDELFSRVHPRLLVVYGDVNSTVAAALVAAKRGIASAHVEAGLRSRDRNMPEELNRLVTDQLCDRLLTHSREASANLAGEGVGAERISFVGNVMIDTLARLLPVARETPTPGIPERFALVTLHRPSNVDDPARLSRLGRYLERLAEKLPVVFPVHPRTRARLQQLQFDPKGRQLLLLDPLDYLSFISLQSRAAVVITDSGGVQEETTYLGTPCLTLRTTTERPVTIDTGTNTLVGDDPEQLSTHIDQILDGKYKRGSIPELWDGAAGTRIAGLISDWVG